MRIGTRGSDLALVLAYVVSVSLSLHIMAAFVLGGLGLDTALNESLLATATIVIIVAFRKGWSSNKCSKKSKS